jgi:hypothetical protein
MKSFYRLYVEEFANTSHMSKLGYWSGIWKLKVPQKIKNLIWRMCCMRVRLQDKGVQFPISCVSYDHPMEDLSHIFFSCSFVVQIWHLAGLWEVVSHVVSTNALATYAIFLFLQSLVVDLCHKMMAIIWSLWKHRNIILWQNKNEVCAQVLDRAHKLMID